ncbi:MAG: Ig-like domain-containing protein [Lysobacterales bacterium]
MKRLKSTGLSVMLSLCVFTSAQAELEDNDGYRQAFTALVSAQVALLPTSFLPSIEGTIAGVIATGFDIGLKFLPPVLRAFTPNPVVPNSPDECHYSFFLPQVEAGYSNLLGLADTQSLPTNWGAFSNPLPPEVEHANTDVALRLNNPFLDDWTSADPVVVFPSGRHALLWQAATQLDPILDIAVPVALFIIANKVKYGKAFFELQTDPKTAARAVEVGGLFLVSAGVEIGVITAGQAGNPLVVDTAVHEQRRFFNVQDVNPPQIEYMPAAGINNSNTPVVLEANSLGGERWENHKDLFRSWIIESDPCDQPLLTGNDAPVLLPIGTNFVEWEALDTGPLGPGNSGRAFLRQKIEVRDTRAPIILVPPARVLESSQSATASDVDIGTAVVFDVADPNPALSNTAPSSFPVNARTEVRWTATDGSGNSDARSQWITVKAPGTNQPPSVTSVAGNALTGQAIDLTLTGSDPDLLSGLFDPLKFAINSQPQNGFFIAPLMPYFIEDYRVRPGNVVGDIINTSNNPANDLFDTFCENGQDIPIDFVYLPQYVVVAVDGVSFVLDRYWRCGASDATTSPRISRWSASGVFEDQKTDISSSIPRITLDRDGFLYTVNPQTNSSDLSLRKFDREFNNLDIWFLEPPSNQSPPVTGGRLKSARMDSATGIIYATDQVGVFAYDGADGQQEPAFLGGLKNNDRFMSGQTIITGSNGGYAVEVDSAGFVYVMDSGFDRIHRFEPPQRNGAAVTLGAHIGWLGRCDSGPNCDDDNQRSIGYSCTDTTCVDLVANGSNCGSQTGGLCTNGSAAGQFDVPTGMGLDDEDILYVTDYNNARVQRFSAIGDFAGEAASTCDGSCFVLGDMGRPEDISVNANKFFVIDRDRALMHVFETAPFKDITDNSVVLSYSSNNNFQGTDSFTFSADDGLATSNIATATINVTRNFRPPESFDDAISLNEDSTADVNLLASDPDGIAGIDFNGLDELTYRIVTPPSHGTLDGSNNMLTYTPELNFNGLDSLSFEVSDGTFTSNVSTVTLTVNPVNDKPQLRFMDDGSKVLPKGLSDLLKGQVVNTGFEAGLGFPVPLMAEFDDPDAGQAHALQITWGDGETDSVNQTPPADPNAPQNDAIITVAAAGTGQVLAQHVYLTPGAKAVQVLVIDEEGAGSNAEDALLADVTVLPMVDLALEALPVDDPLVQPGQVARLMINVSNELPQLPVEGLSASNVVFTGVLPDGVQLMSFETTKGSCGHDAVTTTCQLGALSPGEIVTVTIAMAPDINFDPQAMGYAIDVTSTERDATGSNLTMELVPVLPQVVFQSGFE